MILLHPDLSRVFSGDLHTSQAVANAEWGGQAPQPAPHVTIYLRRAPDPFSRSPMLRMVTCIILGVPLPACGWPCRPRCCCRVGAVLDGYRPLQHVPAACHPVHSWVNTCILESPVLTPWKNTHNTCDCLQVPAAAAAAGLPVQPWRSWDGCTGGLLGGGCSCSGTPQAGAGPASTSAGRLESWPLGRCKALFSSCSKAALQGRGPLQKN